ncbi:MAG TPA: hypothetical protein VIC84_25740 [Blastocatellia bacterium]|jgi:hypothetical protein
MRLRFGNPVIDILGYLHDHDKDGVEPVDIVLVQLQKTPYVVWETPSDG